MNKKTFLICATTALIVFTACKKEQNTPPPSPDGPDAAGCLPASLQTDLIAYYPFSGGSINDFSGNGMHLVNGTSAHAASDRGGNPECAFQFDANHGDFLETGQTSLLNGLNTFSVSLWYQPMDSTRAGGDYEVLIGRGTGMSCPDRHGDWSVSLYDCRKAVFARLNSIWDLDVTTPFDCQQEVYARTGSWHHLVATLDNGEMKLYRDGVLQETVSGVAGCGTTPTIQDIGNLFLGKQYTGKLDDVLIYSRVLNQVEVGLLFEAEACCE